MNKIKKEIGGDQSLFPSSCRPKPLSRRKSSFLLYLFLVLKRFFARKADLALPVDLQDLHEDLVPFLELVRYFLDPLVGYLGDVEQPVGAGEDLHKSAEVHDLSDLAHVELADLGVLHNAPDDLLGFVRRGLIGRRNVDHAAVLDVDLGARLLHDAADHLASAPDHVLDLVRVDLHGDDPGREGIQVLPRGGKRLEHLAQDVQPSVFCLLEGRAHDIDRDALDLHVHLEGGYAGARPGYFEIHITEMVFKAEDIGKDDDLIAFLDEPHGDARDRGLDRHSRVHKRERPAADGGHGR